jgi:hypothetical protein
MAALALIVAGCGGATKQTKLQREIAVVKGWTNALRKGDVHGAASYFALPSIFVNGLGPGGQMAELRITSAHLAFGANASLSCGAVFFSATQRGRYLNVLFTLTGRPGVGGSDCSGGVGDKAQTDFLIKGGKIAAWIRGPDVPQGGNTPNPQQPVITGPQDSV